MNITQGTVVWLHDGQARFPHYVFSGETDAATEGYFSLTSAVGSEIVIAKLSAEEFNAAAAGLVAATARVSCALNRTDLRCVTLLRVERPPAERGESFQSFRSNQGTAKHVYSTLSGKSEALVVGKQSPAEFEASGGVIHRADA
jgi:hypothetical protein